MADVAHWWESGSQAAAPEGPPALAREKLNQPQPGKGSSQAPGLSVTFHHTQLLDPGGERR